MKKYLIILVIFLSYSCENDNPDPLPDPKEYSLTLNINPAGAGILSESSGVYEENESFSILATANENYNFDGWSGSIISSDNPLSVKMDSDKTITANFNSVEIPSVEVYTNTIFIPTDNEKPEDITRTFYDPSGVFSYSINESIYTFYPGKADWISGQNVNTEDVEEVSSQILKKEGNIWVFHNNDLEASFWGIRNYEILGNKVVIGDGNEIGSDFSKWKGNVFMGDINNGGIDWKKVNKSNEMGFFHGTCTGDINGDGLLDIGVTPGINHNGINLFIQNPDGSFDRKDELLEFVGFTPFTIDFADLDGDNLDEIITADYGGGNIPDEDDHEIRIYKYDQSSEKFKLHFQINEPNIYTWGLGATSIKVHDFNNDGINDIAVAREDLQQMGFEIWRGVGDAKFELMFSSPTFSTSEIQFREFSVFDANNDGNMDILLRPSHGELFREWNDNVKIKLNHLIWINNGSGIFNFYNEKELSFENINVHNLLPYSQNGDLHFVGTYYEEDSKPEILTVDIKINF